MRINKDKLTKKLTLMKDNKPHKTIYSDNLGMYYLFEIKDGKETYTGHKSDNPLKLEGKITK